MPERDQLPPPALGLTAVSGAMALIAVLVMVQIWLLSAALETYLAGEPASALPAAVVSGVMFLICVFLYGFVDRVDASVSRKR